MALLLAPYNDSMRPGMGFNSFTQQLCVNDAVKLASGRSSERCPPPHYDSTVTPDGGNAQEVAWTARFIDKISEVTHSLNVSSFLQIKCDADGAKSAASFVDINKFEESDINYLIQVRVTNQRLNASNLTEFDPIANLPDSEFTRVYGDCFISGFIEGGEFNALISIKLKDRSKAREIKGWLGAELNFKGPRAPIVNSNMEIDGETTIAVSWKGGGDIKGPTVEDWTLQSLKAVAMEFPKNVMACPVRTNAILTKYTSLRSFYEKKIRGTPLNYDNVGVYTSALLDAYMEYKIIRRNIQQAIWEVEEGRSVAIGKGNVPKLAKLLSSTKSNQDQQSLDQSEPSMPHNNLVPYGCSVLGLDNAMRDCRLEMVKIVREMDKVAEDPKVACDPMRACRYLSPIVFRMLLPTVKNLHKERAAQLAMEEAKNAADAQTKAQEQLRVELASLQRKLDESEQHRRAAESSKKELEDKLREAEAVTRELNPYRGWCPVEVRTPVRIRSHISKKSMDYYYDEGKGNCSFRQWESAVKNLNQRFEILPVGLKGFSIRHISSGRYLTTGNVGKWGTSGVYMAIGDFPTIFTFEAQKDDAGLWNGSVMVRFAEQNQYTLNVEGGGQGNGVKLLGYAGEKGTCDIWYIKNFDDSI
ncbi:hypothetical protein C8R44DRAFT_773925 [Mycena epipterygia]|nr:hypothetical protein C8R44DRAFT_773925 [Mycena epipterygia]